jgi:hypothetical protein
MNKLALLLPGIIIISNVAAQDQNTDRVPKQYSIEFGYRNVFSTIWLGNAAITEFSNKATNGGSILADYAWQLTGFNKIKKKAFISAVLGYTFINGNNSTNKNVSILSYGLAIRHELAKDKPLIPFLGYGLMLNQLSFSGTQGEIIGHNTRLEFGYNYYKSPHFVPFVKVQYSYVRFPKLYETQSYHVQSFELDFGARF